MFSSIAALTSRFGRIAPPGRVNGSKTGDGSDTPVEGVARTGRVIVAPGGCGMFTLLT